MKNLLFIALSVLLFAACNTSSKEEPKSANQDLAGKFVINGVAPHMQDGDSVLVIDFVINGVAPHMQDGDSVLVIDKLNGGVPLGVAAVRNGKFTISGQASEPAYAAIGPKNGRQTVVFIVEQGTINLSMEDGSATGTPLNDEMQAYADTIDQFADEEEFKAYSLNLYNAHKEDVLGYFVFEFVKDFLSYEEMKELLDNATPLVKNDSRNLAALKNKEKLAAIARENRYVDVTGAMMKATKVNGRYYAENSYMAISNMLAEGKPVLVDFWASWCGPCRKEIPVIAEVAKKYRGRINVLGIAVWEKDPADTRKAMAELPISWPVIYNENGADAYGINAIPFIMLIAPDGKILGTNLRGDDIEVAVKAAL